MEGIVGELRSLIVRISCAASLSTTLVLRNKHKIQTPYRTMPCERNDWAIRERPHRQEPS